MHSCAVNFCVWHGVSSFPMWSIGLPQVWRTKALIVLSPNRMTVPKKTGILCPTRCKSPLKSPSVRLCSLTSFAWVKSFFRWTWLVHVPMLPCPPLESRAYPRAWGQLRCTVDDTCNASYPSLLWFHSTSNVYSNMTIVGTLLICVFYISCGAIK